MIQLHIVYDAVDINLQAGGYAVLDGFYPKSGRSASERLTEEIPVYIKAATSAGRETLYRALGLAFEQARRFADGASPVYVQFGIDASATLWRAQVFDGSAMLDARVSPRWKAGTVRVQVLIEREAGWNGAETQLAITNGNGTNNTSGLRVHNSGSGAGTSPNVDHNYLAITGADVIGDLPGATRLEMIYGKAGADGYNLRNIWIGQSWNDPANMLTYLSLTSGNPHSVPSGTGMTTMGSLTLTDAAVQAAKGQFVKGLLRYYLSSSQFDITYQMRLSSGGITLYDGPLVRTNTKVAFATRDIGSMRIPPIPYTFGSLDGMTLEILATQTTGGTLALSMLDFHLIPMDGFRYIGLKKRVLTGERVMDDGINGTTYQDDGSGTNRIVAASTVGEPITLYPGKDQRLYIMTHTDTLDTPGDTNYLTCKVYYRPRRLGL